MTITFRRPTYELLPFSNCAHAVCSKGCKKFTSAHFVCELFTEFHLCRKNMRYYWPWPIFTLTALRRRGNLVSHQQHVSCFLLMSWPLLLSQQNCAISVAVKLNINWIQASVAKRLEMVLLHTALNLWTCTPTCKNPMTSPRFVCRPGRLRVCASTFPRFVRDVMWGNTGRTNWKFWMIFLTWIQKKALLKFARHNLSPGRMWYARRCGDIAASTSYKEHENGCYYASIPSRGEPFLVRPRLIRVSFPISKCYISKTNENTKQVKS